MSFRFCVLGTGSSGNATLLQIEEEGQETNILLDAGFSPKETNKRLASVDCSVEALDAILLTHFHGDHFRESWFDVCAKQKLKVCFHERHARLWWKHARYDIPTQAFKFAFDLTPQTKVRPFELPHDQQGCVGYIFTHDERKLAFLTDLGHVPDEVLKQLKDLDILALESNYDPAMQKASPRPRFLKRRITSHLGHLSNQQCFDATVKIAKASSQLQHILLLHLSQQCNMPELIEELFEEGAPALLPKLIFTHQKKPTGWITLV